MRANVQMSVHDTEQALWDELARVFGATEGGAHRWVTLKTESGVEVTFYAIEHVEEAVQS